MNASTPSVPYQAVCAHGAESTPPGELPVQRNLMSWAPAPEGPWSEPVSVDAVLDAAVPWGQSDLAVPGSGNTNLIIDIADDGSMNGLWRRCCSPPDGYGPPDGGGESMIYSIRGDDWRDVSTWVANGTAVFPQLLKNGYEGRPAHQSTPSSPPTPASPSEHHTTATSVRPSVRPSVRLASSPPRPRILTIATTHSRNRTEDPHLWRDPRRPGVLHAVFHNMIGGWHAPMYNKTQVGAHAYSADGGASWVDTGVAFNWTVQFTDGSSVDMIRRERPHMLLNEKGNPLALSSAVQYALNEIGSTSTLIQLIGQ